MKRPRKGTRAASVLAMWDDARRRGVDVSVSAIARHVGVANSYVRAVVGRYRRGLPLLIKSTMQAKPYRWSGIKAEVYREMHREILRLGWSIQKLTTVTGISSSDIRRWIAGYDMSPAHTKLMLIALNMRLTARVKSNVDVQHDGKVDSDGMGGGRPESDDNESRDHEG